MVFGVDGVASSAVTVVLFLQTHLICSNMRRVSSGLQVGQSDVRMNKKVVGKEGVLRTDTKVMMKKIQND